MDELKQASKEMIAGFVANTQSGLPIKKVLWRSGTIIVILTKKQTDNKFEN